MSREYQVTRKKSSKPAARAALDAWCARCRGRMPVGHVCPSGNAADLALGRRAVVAVRIDRKTLDRLGALVARRSQSQRWPRVTVSALVLESVLTLLKAEGL